MGLISRLPSFLIALSIITPRDHSYIFSHRSAHTHIQPLYTPPIYIGLGLSPLIISFVTGVAGYIIISMQDLRPCSSSTFLIYWQLTLSNLINNIYNTTELNSSSILGHYNFRYDTNSLPYFSVHVHTPCEWGYIDNIHNIWPRNIQQLGRSPDSWSSVLLSQNSYWLGMIVSMSFIKYTIISHNPGIVTPPSGQLQHCALVSLSII